MVCFFRCMCFFFAGWLLVSCGGGEPTSPVLVLNEIWVNRGFYKANLDSLVFWPEKKWVLATAKSTHEVVVFDAEQGSLIQKAGGEGRKPGLLKRPNGIAVSGNRLFVVERDNHRVQVLSLPGLKSLGFFGEDILKRPYVITVYPISNKACRVYVTDNHEPDIPSESALKERIKLFEVEKTKDGIKDVWIKSFGDSKNEGILPKVESIAVDPQYKRLLIADEENLKIKIYDLEGNFIRLLSEDPVFRYEPEGIALYKKPGGEGVWVMVDQKETHTRFILFDRQSLNYLGYFTGKGTANTDGIALTEASFTGFSQGALFAVHDDTGVAAFSWKDVAEAIEFLRDGT